MTEKTLQEQEAIREKVRAGYSEIAETGALSCCSPATEPVSACCSGSADGLAQQLGYDAADLAALPEGANMGLSCGNPTALASLREGETVVDLGSGGGFDVFLAAGKVGQSGRAIGVDMTPSMLTKARRNAEKFVEQTGLDNAEFRLGEIEHLPLPDNCADVVISNCVINLSPDKPQVYREIFRVLKPSGRAAISDLALLRPLPQAVEKMVAALVGCVAGASLVEDVRAMLTEAGLVDIDLTPEPVFTEAQKVSQDGLWEEIARHLPEGLKPSDYVTSLSIAAKKPA